MTSILASPAARGRQRLVAWLRISAVVSLLFAVGHMLGGLEAWSPGGASPALRAMGAYRFRVEGVNRTFVDFYRGFGFTLGVFMLLQAMVLWQVAALAMSDGIRLRPMIGAFAMASIAVSVIAAVFIMPVPAAFSIALSACLGVAFLVGE